tara:strand:- start:3336 stop:4301 length:966 start_codon:yes stop_codon:yes gene_type:complete
MLDKGTIRLYGCGGFGINNVAFFNNAGEEPNCANVETAYIDTSRSNLTPEFKEDDVFILPNVDGSGKVRRENHKEIANVVKQILLQLEPGDFNVVVFSASGGSGSVVGPLIMAELLSRGLTAVAIVVGSDESIITATNTFNTLKSLESIAQRTELPAVMYYEHNDRDRKRSEVDTQIRLAVSTLTVLANRQNREIDTKDISNWAQFSKTTSVGPQLAQLEVFTNSEDADAVNDPISIASVYVTDDIRPIAAVPEYHAAGYLNEHSEQFDQLHFVISIDAMPNLVGSIKKTLDQYHQQRDSRAKQQSILTDDDSTTADGLVL